MILPIPAPGLAGEDGPPYYGRYISRVGHESALYLGNRGEHRIADYF